MNAKPTAPKLNPLAWVRRLYSVGNALRFRANDAQRVAAELAKHEAAVRRLRRELRDLDRAAEAAALAAGYTADQVAAARAGDTLTDDGLRWANSAADDEQKARY